MAQSRINKAASIFTRLDGLIKSNLIPWKDRPIWYDVYKTSPPLRDPRYRSVLGKEPVAPLPPKIFYKEDELRAFYFKNIEGSDTLVLNSNIVKPKWEIFIQVYKSLSKQGISKENLINSTVEEMQKRGYYVQFKKSKEPQLSSEPPLSLLEEGSLEDLNRLAADPREDLVQKKTKRTR